MPRTTLQLDDDAMTRARAHAERHQLTLGEAVSELVIRGAEKPVVTEHRNGLHVIRLGRHSPTIKASDVDELSREWP